MTRRRHNHEEATEGNAEPSEGGPVRGMIVHVERVEMVNEWPLAVAREAPEPLTMASEASRRLEFARLAVFNQLVRRTFPGEKLRQIALVETRATVGATTRTSYEFALTKKQLIKLIMRSETAVAERIQDEIIDVYDAWTAGKLQQAEHARVGLADLEARIPTMISAAVKAAVAGALQDGDPYRSPCAGSWGAKGVKFRLKEYAAIMAIAEPETTARSHRKAGETKMRAAIEFNGLGSRLELMTNDQHGKAYAILEGMIIQAKRLAAVKQRGGYRQRDMFEDFLGTEKKKGDKL